MGAAFWYNRFTPDGVEKHHFFSWQTYTWDDAYYYTLKANRDGVLKFELVMEDGEAFFFIDNNVEYISDGFYEKFPDSVYDYSVWLAQTLRNQGKELRVDEALNVVIRY